MTDVEFFWDPVCPWAWITSCWIRNVQAERPTMAVDWRFISLRMVNAGKDYDKDFPPGYTLVHGRGLRLLRVAAAVKAASEPEQVGALYRAYGLQMHNGGNREYFDDPDNLRATLQQLGLAADLAGAVDASEFDAEIQASTDEALARCGGNVGTPIISWQPPDGPSFFGPVISKAPSGPEAVRLWDAITELGANPWFAELKRSVRARPIFD
ncbi:MAG: DsbA family protein [Acidimicrobiales bacterium]